ncbi:MAG: Gldg family protein [Proteobacteria bacterium]|nr:Gldg family protein [Pseudomonadota bacterium]
MSALWSLACLAALLVLFAAGLRLRVYGAGWRRWVLRLGLIVGAVAATLAANVAVYRHDAHLDFTREQAFTPSTEASDIVRGLTEPVQVVYFFQKENAAGRGLATMLELLGRLNPLLAVEMVDIDRNPARASSFGVQLYNTAVIVTSSHRLQVLTTDDREIALGILRALRRQQPVVCFVTGHGEYDIDNFEFHTHFEGSHSHSHNTEGMALVQMEQHGLGRMRRALEKLGLEPRKVELRPGRPLPEDCAALVDANPRTPHLPVEADLLRTYLAGGGSYMLLVEPDFAIEERLAAVIADAGARVGSGVIVDPADHYFTDEQMIAITKYANHPVTRSQALSFYPGARPVEPVARDGVRAVALFASSPQSYVVQDRARYREEGASAPRRSYPLAVAAEGKLAADARPFRLIVVGDADFASNSFFPYLANADIVLAGVSWLLHEERRPSLKPPVEVLPTVTLTSAQVRWIFILTVILLPGAVACTGLGVWLWRRR